MFTKFSLFIILFLALLLIVGLPLDGINAQPPPISITNPLTSDSFDELIAELAKWIFNIAIALATVMFLIGGFQFLVSGGNEEKVTKAKKTMLWSAVGLAVCLMGAGITSIIKQLLGVS